MADGITQELARRFLARNQDIAKDLRGMGAEGNTSGYKSTPTQQMRYSMANVQASGDNNTRLRYPDGSPAKGISEAYKDRSLFEFEDPYFNNLPLLLDRDAYGNSVDSSTPGRPNFLNLSDMVEGPNGSGDQYTRLELLAGEMLALSQKAMNGEASPEELELLNTYQEFMQSRTGS